MAQELQTEAQKAFEAWKNKTDRTTY